jgi:TatD DNase family protein
MIDVHAHLCFPPFDPYRDKLIEVARREILGIVGSSARHDEGVKLLELASKNSDFIFPTLGYHPTEGKGLEGVFKLIEENKGKVVGVGEVGLDYHWEKDPKKRDEQKEVFRKFIDLAKKLKKPIVIHSWDAERDCFEMVKDGGLDCVFHCYSGSRELAGEIIKKGFFISVSTQVLFSKGIRKVAKDIPLGQILLETDAPFLSPYKMGMELPKDYPFPPEINAPWNIKLSGAKIAELRKIPTEELLQHAKENAVGVFGLPLK